MTLIDLRIEYKRETGDFCVPLSHDFYKATDYIVWLEERLVKIQNTFGIKGEDLKLIMKRQ